MTHSLGTVADRLYLRWATRLDQPDGGFTVSVLLGTEVSRGFAVSEYPDANRQLVGPVDPHHIRSYVLEHRDTLREPGNYLGGWRDPESGIAHLDIVRVYDDENEAAMAARENKELAYYDFDGQRSVFV